MSGPGFGKLYFLLSSQAKQAYAAHICNHIHQVLVAETAHIQTKLSGVVPKGYILVTDAHSSASDPKPHYTIDAYDKDKNGFDKPIGCIHMYRDNQINVYAKPRTLAINAYREKSAGSS